MRKPRGLRSNTPYVHIEKDRGGEAIVLNSIRGRFQQQAQECAAEIDRINSSCGESVRSPARIPYECGLSTRKDDEDILPQETYSTLYHVGGIGLAASLVVALTFIFIVKAKAQPTAEQMFSPPEVFCTGAQHHIKNVLSKTGMFKDAFPLSGEGARQVSKNIFNHTPPADHILIIRQVNGGSIMVPCVWGKSGPEWSGEQSNRVEIDFVFRRELETPKTQISSDEIKQKSKKRGAKQ